MADQKSKDMNKHQPNAATPVGYGGDVTRDDVAPGGGSPGSTDSDGQGGAGSRQEGADAVAGESIGGPAGSDSAGDEQEKAKGRS